MQDKAFTTFSIVVTVAILLVFFISPTWNTHLKTVELKNGASLTNKILIGMRRIDVSEILGDQNLDISPNGLVLDRYGGGIFMHKGTIEEWNKHNGVIQVVFSNEGRVVYSRWVPAY